MKDIDQVHIGRVPFGIERAARKELQDYLEAIGKQTPEAFREEMLRDIEARIVDILAEHHVPSGSVITVQDIKTLRAQLGEPKDFADTDRNEEPADKQREQAGDLDHGTSSEGQGFFRRKLYRDEKRGMLAGVCYGIAKQVDIDPLWIRLLFVMLSFANGIGIGVYIVLALLVPNAKDDADRLKMEGKPVTIKQLQWLKTENTKETMGKIQTITAPLWKAFVRIMEWAVAAIGVVAIAVLLAAFTLAAGVMNGADTELFGAPIVQQSGYVQIALGAVVAMIASLLLLIVLGMMAGLFRRKIPAAVSITVATLFGVSVLALAGTAYRAAQDAQRIAKKYPQSAAQRFFDVNNVRIEPGHIEISSSETIDMSGTGLTSIQPDLYNNGSVVSLRLSHNTLTSLPSEMGRMTQLRALFVDYNQLTGSLIGEVRHLKNLEVLNASHNNFTGIPAEIGQLANLQQLDLSYNNISGVPNEITQLRDNLKLLDLRSNPIPQARIDVLRKQMPNTRVEF